MCPVWATFTTINSFINDQLAVLSLDHIVRVQGYLFAFESVHRIDRRPFSKSLDVLPILPYVLFYPSYGIESKYLYKAGNFSQSEIERRFYRTATYRCYSEMVSGIVAWLNVNSMPLDHTACLTVSADRWFAVYFCLSTYLYLLLQTVNLRHWAAVAYWLWTATLTRKVAGPNPGKSHWWTTGRASGPKMLTTPAKSQLTIGHRPSPVKTGSVWRKTTSLSSVNYQT